MQRQGRPSRWKPGSKSPRVLDIHLLVKDFVAREERGFHASPTCAESGVGSGQINALAEKSSLHFGRGPGSGGRSEGLPLGRGKAHALGQDDAKTVKQSRLGGVTIDIAVADRRVRSVHIESTRPTNIARLFIGRPVDDIPVLAERLFSLCGRSYRLAAAR